MNALNTELVSGGAFVGRSEELRALVYNLMLEPKPVVLLRGAAGTGKTSLLQEFVRSSAHILPGGVEVQYAYTLRHSNRVELQLIDSSRRSLLVIEEAELLTNSQLASILKQLAATPAVSTLLVSRLRPRAMPVGTVEIAVGPLEMADWESLIRNSYVSFDKENVKRYFRKVGGHAASLALAAHAVADGSLTLQDLIRQFASFEVPGILGPDGQPYSPNIALPEPIVEVCTHLEEKLFNAVSRNPELMHQISPRDFELLVAELLHRQGFDIQVTPPSKDGGVDIYAAQANALGNFLFLIECKRYARSNPVKVDVVRALYGNVQAKRATSGIVITTSTFTRGAKAFQSELRHQLDLRDYLSLQDWLAKVRPMID